MPCIECQWIINEKPRDDSTPRCSRSRGPCSCSDEFKACINQIPIFFTAIAFSMNRTLNCSGSEGDIMDKNKATLTMSATRAQSWIVVRQGVEWTITCARENILVFAFMLSLIYIKIMCKCCIEKRVNINTHTNFFTLARVWVSE